MRATREDVGGQGGCTFDGHGLLATQFKQSHFSRKRAGEGLCVTHKTGGGGERKIVSDFEQLLNAFVCNEMTHGCAVICSNHDATPLNVIPTVLVPVFMTVCCSAMVSSPPRHFLNLEA